MKNSLYNLPRKTAEPQIYECPFAEELKPHLMKWVQDEAHIEVQGKALRTENYFKPETKELDKLFEWIWEVLPEAVEVLGHWSNSFYFMTPREMRIFTLDQYWAMSYQKGGGTDEHTHFPYPISFGYYINVPEGSSPVIIEDEEISLTDGRLVVFMGHQRHWVPESEVDGRCMIAGDITYTPFLSDISNYNTHWSAI